MQKMFCYQCEQTVGGKGCTRVGVCGKNDQVAALQDLLIYQLKGIGYFGSKVLESGRTIDMDTHKFVVDAAFATLTNVDFDPSRFQALLQQSANVKTLLHELAGTLEGLPEAARYQLPQDESQRVVDASKVGVISDTDLDEDVRSLRETIMYGLKGMAAYAHHAYLLGQTDEKVFNFFYKALAALIDNKLDVDALFDLTMQVGTTNIRCMELLDAANTGNYGNPEPTQALISKKKGPFIVVSGHDLKDLKHLLEQTEGTGVNVYTHGEMLPTLAYPELKKHDHLVGNYGGAWQDQQKEFAHLPGAVLMTTNCIQRPLDSYKDRIFTTGLVGWPEIEHIETVNGKKDFSPVIEKALSLGGWAEDEEEKHILIGFGHAATLSYADKIISAVKNGAVKHFFLVGGCDGAKPGRNYYTEFAEKTPDDTIIMTLACGKYRFNKTDFGTIGELPRLLDVGQCNDAFSAVKIALALADAFDCDINELPLSLVLSWYEQKAVVILLSLLSLGVKDIYLGPTLPAFITPNILDVLVKKFNITPTSTVEADLKAMLG